ncbi:ankyrin repeat domain-containing protein, partial [Parashewanella curva]
LDEACKITEGAIQQGSEGITGVMQQAAQDLKVKSNAQYHVANSNAQHDASKIQPSTVVSFRELEQRSLEEERNSIAALNESPTLSVSRQQTTSTSISPVASNGDTKKPILEKKDDVVILEMIGGDLPSRHREALSARALPSPAPRPQPSPEIRNKLKPDLELESQSTSVANKNVESETDLNSRLLNACQKGDTSKLKEQLPPTFDVNQPLQFSSLQEKVTLLHVACVQGHVEIIDYLISRGANVNAVTELGFTPLYFAILRSQSQVVERLIKENVNIDIETQGKTPLQLAIARGDDAIVQLLNL